jgi:hypothetical protein
MGRIIGLVHHAEQKIGTAGLLIHVQVVPPQEVADKFPRSGMIFTLLYAIQPHSAKLLAQLAQ